MYKKEDVFNSFSNYTSDKQTLTKESKEEFEKELNKLLLTEFYKFSQEKKSSLFCHLKKTQHSHDRHHLDDLIRNLDNKGIKLEPSIAKKVFRSKNQEKNFIIMSGKLSAISTNDRFWQRISRSYYKNKEEINIIWILGSWRTCLVINNEKWNGIIEEEEIYLQKDRKGQIKGLDLEYLVDEEVLKIRSQSGEPKIIPANEILNKWETLNLPYLSPSFSNLTTNEASKILSDASRLLKLLEFQEKSSLNLVKQFQNGEVKEDLETIDKGSVSFPLYENTEIDPIKIIKALETKHQVILMGPPGTSKSFLAKEIAKTVATKEENIHIVQFHPSYSYEEFVEAKEVEEGKSEKILSFSVTPKKFRSVCNEAIQNRSEKYVLILDELNRGNTEKIFGELIYAIENRDRGIDLLYSGDELIVPKNLYIICTMNTVDLSISNIDAAILRRFFLIDIHPDSKLLFNWLNSMHLDKSEKYRNEFRDLVVKFMNDINKKIDEKSSYIGNYQKVGHTYFMIEKGTTIEEKWKYLQMYWEYSIRPLLLQYHNYDNEAIVEYDNLFDDLTEEVNNLG